jgi:hypothetical protein
MAHPLIIVDGILCQSKDKKSTRKSEKKGFMVEGSRVRHDFRTFEVHYLSSAQLHPSPEPVCGVQFDFLRRFDLAALTGESGKHLDNTMANNPVCRFRGIIHVD